MTNAALVAWFGESEEPRRLSSVCLTCRYGRIGTEREQPRPKTARRKQGTLHKRRAFEHVATVWVVLAEQVEWIDRESPVSIDREKSPVSNEEK